MTSVVSGNSTPDPAPRRLPGLKHLAGLAALVALLVVVERQIGWSSVLAAWRAASTGAVAAAAMLLLASYELRALRLEDWHPALRERRVLALKLILEHNLYNTVLPFRSGEAAFPLLLGRYFGVALGPALASLLWLRLLDLHVVLGLGLVALASLAGGTTAAFAAALAWLPLPWLAHRWQPRIAAGVVARLPASWAARLRPLTGAGAVVTPGRLLRAWLKTLLLWSVKLAAFAGIVAAFAGSTPALSLLGAVGGELSSVLPIHSFAGIGTYEAGVLAGLVPFGIALDPALTAAVNLHLFLLATSVAAGALALALPERTL